MMNLKIIKKYLSNLFGILFSRISGFLRDLCLANYLGAGYFSDLFFVMIRLPSIFRALFTEGVFNQSFLPNLAASQKKGAFCIQILCIFCTFLAILCLIISIFSKFFISLIFFGFDDNFIKEAASLNAINIWYLLLIFIACFFASLLNYSNRFFISSISASFFNLACVFALIYAKEYDKLEKLYFVSYFIICSSFVQIILLLLALKSNKILKAMFLSFRKKSKISLKNFFKNFFSSLLGASSTQINSLVEISLASTLVSASISYMNYATRIYQLPLALIAIAFTQVFFPTLIRLIKANEKEQMLNSMSMIFHLMLFLLLFACLGGFILSEEIIKLLFFRGAFTYLNVLECAKVLRIYILCIVPLGLSRLFLAYINANYLHSYAAKIALISCVICIISSLTLIKFFGVLAFCISANISAWFIFFAYLKCFKISNFVAILKLKYCLIIFLSAIIFSFALIYLKGFINAFI